MTRRAIRALVLLACCHQLAALGGVVRAHEPDVIAPSALRYRVTAGQPRLNRKALGPVTTTIQGVPAQPVDSMVYDGEGSVPIEGHFYMVVDPIAEVGIIQVSWTDANGEWTLTQGEFRHPEHASGARFSASASQIQLLANEGITHNVYLHGDTGAAMSVMPTLFCHLAAWGPADVTLDGLPFVNPYELPAPQWLSHVMVTEGVRNPDGTVRTVFGGIYHPGLASEGASDPADLEVHVTFHDERFPSTDNFPPLFSFQYHLVFEDVSIQLVAADEAIPVDPPDDEDDRPSFAIPRHFHRVGR